MKEEQFLADARTEVVMRSGTIFDALTSRLTSKCESPIERMFAVALIKHSLCLWPFSGMVFMHSSSERWPEWPRRIGISVCIPQASIGKYRADFLIARRISDGASESAFQRIVIECDGHDYHERTKEQAAKDRRKDRFLSSRGYTVVRFTGSEIFNDPDRCVDDLAAIWYDVPLEGK